MPIGPEFDGVLAAAQTGAEWAFTALYRDLNPRLLRFLAVQAPSFGEDLAAETWMAAARQLGSFSGDEGAFRGWMFTIARRRLIQHWRTMGRRPQVTTSIDLMTDRPAADDPEAAVVASVSAQEATAIITAALTPDQAEIVLLRMLGGLDVDQVAAIVNKRPGTVRVLQHRAVRRLAGVFAVEALTP